MNRKIPPEAFAHYASLGPGRSYDAVAQRFGCSKRGVAEFAKRDRWQERVLELEQRAREKSDTAALESITAMNERHLKIARFLQSKGLEGLQAGRLELLGQATRTCTAGVELERLIRGEPTERTENLESVIRRECDRWLVRDDVSGDGAVGDGDAPG